jgi:hypothetical protein
MSEEELKHPSLDDLVGELTEYVKNIDRLPPHARTSPATNADLAYVGTMILGIITHLNTNFSAGRDITC